MIARYTGAAMGRIWSEQRRFECWLQVEIAAAEAMADAGIIPASAAAAIRERGAFDIARIEEIEAKTRHDVIAFTTAVAEKVGEEARWLHFGLTSSDVIDTAQALQMREACDLILDGLAKLGDAIRARAEEHRHTPMMGRTHGVHAEPISLGLKLALWYAENQRNIERVRRARAAINVGKLSGAVGTFAHLDPSIEAAVCARLGLEPAPVSSQIIQRDRHAELLSTLAITAASLEKFALEIRGLQKTEIGEIEEPFETGQKGSSAMPHKRNPIGCEQVVGLARLLRGNAMAGMENVALWHERDISHSSVERVILPDSFIALDHVLRRFTKIVRNMVVYPERMRENLERSRGVVFSGTILLELAKRGVSREQAYEWVQRNAMRSFQEQRPFKQLLLEDEEVGRVLSAADIERAFDLSVHLRHVDRVLREGVRRWSRPPGLSMFDKLHEECGVFGIFGHPEASKMAYLGLYALQHRGQESTGIAASDGERLIAYRAMGHVADVFTEAELARLPGRLAVGHVRYSTAGASKLVNAQPILIDCQHGQIALCHNGNLVNAAELREELSRDGAIFQTSSDSEVILHLYAHSRARARRGRARRIAGAASRRLLAGARDGRPADCRPRPARLQAAGDRPPRGRDRGRFRNVRDGPHRRHLGARRRAGRGRRRRRRRPPVDQAVPARPPVAVHLRARLLRAARQLRVRRERQRRPHRVRPAARAGVARRGRRRRPGARLRGVRRHRVRRGGRHPASDGPDPQSLRRPDVHRAAAVDPALRREGEAEPRAEHSRRPACRARGRFDRARHDVAEDRADDQGGGRARGARADQLSADDFAVLLRRGHATTRRADRGDPHARGDPEDTWRPTRCAT